MKPKRKTAAGILGKPGGEKAYALRQIERDEKRRAKEGGLGITRQATAICRKYLDQLEGLICRDLLHSRRNENKEKMWQALRGKDEKPNVEEIAERLLRNGLTAAGCSTIGVDRKEGGKVARNVLLWLGDVLSQSQQKDIELEFRIGAWGVSLLLHLVDVFTLDDDKILALSQSKSLACIRKEAIEWAAYNNPRLLPSNKQLAPWTGVRQGPLGSRVPLVSRRYSEAAVQEAIENGQMRRVLESVHYLQDTWFTINEPILEIAKQLAPELPDPPDETLSRWHPAKKQFRNAKRKVGYYHTDMEIADMMLDRGRFCLPYDLDFRSRTYPIAHFSFLRADHIRGLFRFDPGERLGDGDGLDWLKYHVAGCADGNKWEWSDERKPSKLSHDERIAWTERNRKDLCKIAADVLNGIAPDRKLLPEDPIQFLAACVELKRALDTKPVSDFITTLPIKFDGCCSGLQHYCGLMRAPEGHLAGLSPGEVADDFYIEVVKRVKPDNSEILDGSNDRGIVKKPVQARSYGAGTKKICRELEHILRELGREIDEAQTMKLADAICHAYDELAPAAKKVRSFVGRMARLYADAGMGLQWPTMAEFPVLNVYYKPRVIENITVRLGPKYRLTNNLTVGDLPQIGLLKSQRSASANFIHSLDATHLHEVVWMCKAARIRLVTAHDAFACLAPQATVLNHIIRERFIAVHSISYQMLVDMLENAKRDLPGAKLPKLPVQPGPDYLELGGLDVSKMLEQQERQPGSPRLHFKGVFKSKKGWA
jgi:DNA-directed RNA polymerase